MCPHKSFLLEFELRKVSLEQNTLKSQSAVSFTVFKAQVFSPSPEIPILLKTRKKEKPLLSSSERERARRRKRAQVLPLNS
jgi:hypothetical protein